jgi:arylsulfatase A-like enzyme
MPTIALRRRGGGFLLGAALLVNLAGGACGRRVPPNIVLVSIDTLRADHVGAYGYSGGTTPFIDSLARDAEVFESAFVPLPATGPSHASLLTSLHPLQHGVTANAMSLSPEVETLAEALRNRGYFTMGAVAVFHMRRQYGFDRGFTLFSDEWKESKPLNSKYERAAPYVNRSVYAMVDSYLGRRSTEPFFLFVHYFDPHSPYVDHEHVGPPGQIPESRGVAGREDAIRRDLIRRYDSEVRFVDEHVRRVYEYLDARGLTRNLIFSVTADHGEQLGEHGFEGGHADIYRETTRVPLILRAPGVSPGVKRGLVSSMDLGVTLLEFAGARYSNSVSGKSLHVKGGGQGRGEQELLILGYPNYTRSVGLLSQDWLFIRNLDQYYRRLAVGPIPEHQTRSRVPWGEAAKLVGARSGAGDYVLPALTGLDSMEPVLVTAEVALKKPECKSEVVIQMGPEQVSMAGRFDFRGGVRVHFPAVPPRDAVVVTVAGCDGEVRYRMRSYDDPHALQGRPPGTNEILETSLWRDFLTLRKRLDRDELYNLNSDPGMVNNLIDEPANATRVRTSRSTIVRRWREVSAHHVRTGEALTQEEQELLKSLGYVR